MSGVNYHAWTHAPKAQGGTDPITFPSGSSSVELSAIASTNTGGLDIPANTWEDAVSVAQLREFTYAFASDGDWSFSNATGIIERSETAAYVGHAQIAWQSIAVGDVIGVAFEFNGVANRFENVIQVVSGATGRVSVTAGLVTNLGFPNPGARAYVYCNPAATITRMEFIVRRFELVADGEEFSF